MVLKMDKTEKMVLTALKEQNPALHQQMAESGQLRAFLADQAEEINDQIINLATRIAAQHKANEAKSFQEKVGILNSANSMATEIVLAEMLQYPQDETSPQSQGETTPLAETI